MLRIGEERLAIGVDVPMRIPLRAHEQPAIEVAALIGDGVASEQSRNHLLGEVSCRLHVGEVNGVTGQAIEVWVVNARLAMIEDLILGRLIEQDPDDPPLRRLRDRLRESRRLARLRRERP
jgi:hypothetical protein